MAAIISTTTSQIPFTCTAAKDCSQSLRINNTIIISSPHHNICPRLFSICTPSRNKCLTSFLKPISAIGSGLEASTGPKISVINIKDAKVVLESKDGDKLKLRVDLTGKETDKVFNLVLRNLARTAPPVPGFRRSKGGKMTNVSFPSCVLWRLLMLNVLNMVLRYAVQVPKEFLLQILGEERVISFAIQEIVSITVADYAKKENLNVKENKVSTVETSEELKSAFVAGKEFGFTATIEIEEEQTLVETDNST